ncbi:hypothetical protein C8P63_11285 [Melghirimyces profundicolus]|uniref:Uncharacterized protein n=1 Tax=Melghirimyces profundicolus TaxID=1242148 RepID=A0A2T6BTL2_9BACL|nr:hypothetical protein C8P63_11285 [Melghirimyces profundicolus]
MPWPTKNLWMPFGEGGIFLFHPVDFAKLNLYLMNFSDPVRPGSGRLSGWARARVDSFVLKLFPV